MGIVREMLSKPSVGTPINRVDARLKVTGRATYSADAPVDGVAYALIVQSTIANGELKSVDARRAGKAHGVISIITPFNAPRLAQPKSDFFTAGVPAESRPPLSDKRIYHAGQHIAVVVAGTIEQARHAAALLKFDYAEEKPVLRVDDDAAAATKPDQSFGNPLQVKRGNTDAVADTPGEVTTVHQTYFTPTETHNPMELSATTAQWDGDRLTVWDATQYIMGTRAFLAETFGIPRENVRVICPFVGGGFGCKGFQWPHTILAAVAARVSGKPVKLMLTRAQMFTSCGHRPEITQTLSLTAKKDGKLVCLTHEVLHDGALTGEYVEACGPATSGVLYAVPNLTLSHTTRKLNVPVPTPMRAPGENPGSFALESALDELAAELRLDPVQLRLINHADTDPESGKPWSSKNLKECYQLGAEKFGWSTRNPSPGVTKDEHGRLIGWGMATATYPGFRFPAAVRLRLTLGGDNSVTALGSSATHDLGTGAYTVFTQITADAVGLPVERVKFELGDSTLPFAPVAGGSNSTASVGQAIVDAAAALKEKLAALVPEGHPLHGLAASELVLKIGLMARKDREDQNIPLAELLVRADKATLDASSSVPGAAPPGDKALPLKPAEGAGAYYQSVANQYKFQSFGCHFVEVAIDPLLPRVQVRRVVSVIDNGRVINPKTARSQIMGGVIMGIGMALMEQSVLDPRNGRCVTDNLADYPLCVNPDIGVLETYFIDKPDPYLNALGARGIGEIGITGVAAAIANAVYHATGQRFRSLPITTEKLLANSGVLA